MADGSRYAPAPTPSLALPFERELVVDLFAGGGGASTGIGSAYREPDIAVNHNAIAIAVHRANHPDTEHYQSDVFEVDPLTATRGRPVGLLWASPDCRHHSKAKGGKPRDKRIRGLAWVVLRWALDVSPRVIELENVEEFVDWCPLDADGHAIKARRGETFDAFVAALSTGLPADHPAMAEIIEFLGSDVHVPALVRGLGYVCDHRELRACDYGVPTIRKRLYFKARRDGVAITWPKPTHAKAATKKMPPWRTAAECLDFSLPARSIFDRKKPLAINTQRRVAKGLWRYVLTAHDPFVVDNSTTQLEIDHETQASVRGNPPRGVASREVRRVPEHLSDGAEGTAATQGHDLQVMRISLAGSQGSLAAYEDPPSHLHAPFLTEHANASTQRTFAANEPLRTQVAQVKGGHFSLVSACLVAAAHGEGKPGGVQRWSIGAKSVDDPLNTVTASGGHALMQAHFIEQANGGYYDGDGREVSDPLSTICTSGANQRLVSAYLVKYYSEGGQWQAANEPMHTVPTKDRMGLVQVVQLPADGIAPECRASAKACADFLHEHLPEHFPKRADIVLVGDHVLVDITLRMLVPRELARAQGFPDSYILDRGLFETEPGSGEYEWRPVTKTDQVRLIGNSVCPGVAEAIVRHDLDPLIRHYARAA